MSGLLYAGPAAPNWLAIRDPRLRILAALGFALVTVGLQRLPALLVALGCAFGLALAAGIGLRQIVRRLLLLEGFMLVLVVMLPFSVPGDAWFTLGDWQASRQGLSLAAVILVKANTVVLALLALLGTLDPAVLGHALARLRMPDKLVHLFLFTVRYIDVLHTEYRRLREAMRARAFVARSDGHSWRSLGWLIGMLLVRSLERAQRIQAAMKCRGFHGRFHLLEDYRWRAGDSLAGVALAGLLGGLLVLERLS